MSFKGFADAVRGVDGQRVEDLAKTLYIRYLRRGVGLDDHSWHNYDLNSITRLNRDADSRICSLCPGLMNLAIRFR